MADGSWPSAVSFQPAIPTKHFRDLKVWQKAHELTLAVYTATHDFPQSERYGLFSRRRRAGASIPANSAAGCGRGTDADFARFLQNAMGSAGEPERHLLLAHDPGYLTYKQHAALDAQVTEVKHMLAGLIARLGADR